MGKKENNPTGLRKLRRSMAKAQLKSEGCVRTCKVDSKETGSFFSREWKAAAQRRANRRSS